MKIKFTKEQYTKYNRLWKEDLEKDENIWLNSNKSHVKINLKKI